MDERVCPICSGLTGKRRKFGEPFSLGIAKPPAHVNCRCWTLPVIKEPR
jgi:SPP1 gp7 family putative phage head morphogenesis protein